MKGMNMNELQNYIPSRKNMEQVLDDKHNGTCWSCRKSLKEHSLKELRECYSKSFTF
jgi:hypothetical protein